MPILYTHGHTVIRTPEQFASYSQIRVDPGDNSGVVLTLGAAGEVDLTKALGPVNAYIQGSAGDDTITAGIGNDHIYGGTGRDVLYGGDGNDSLQGFTGPATDLAVNVFFGGAGNDHMTLFDGDLGTGGGFYGGDGTDTLELYSDHLQRLVLTEANSVEMVTGHLYSHKRTDNVIDLGSAAFKGFITLQGKSDYLRAPHGYYNVYAYVGTSATIYASDMRNEIYGGHEVHAGAGDDLIRDAQLAYGDEGNDAISAETGYGGDGNDYIAFTNDAYGGDGNDVLRGGLTGEVYGGAGRDILLVDGNFSEGGAAVNYTAIHGFGGFESVTFIRAVLSEFDDFLDLSHLAPSRTYTSTIESGAGRDDIRTGNGAQTLDGGTGADTMTGGAGNDVYMVDDSGDRIVEKSGGGRDMVRLTTGYDLANLMGFVERVVIQAGASGFTVMGSAGDDHVYAVGSSDIRLLGAGGRDILIGGENSAVNGGDDNDTLSVVSGRIYGGDGDDRLFGGAGDSTLYGGLGADKMSGGAGSDVYYVDAFDTVAEHGRGGRDEIRTALSSYSLHDISVENLVSLSQTSVTLTGNWNANQLTGTVQGDTLDGSSNADTMTGGRGDDVYYVDDAGDIVNELKGQGIDTIHSTAGEWVLGDTIENGIQDSAGGTMVGNGLGNILSATQSAILAGMGGHDTLVGSDYQDTLDGGTEDDSLTGGRGNDTYVVDSLGDVIVELADTATFYGGEDRVLTQLTTYTLAANIEQLFVNGPGNFVLTGNESDNVIVGNNGNDRMSGGSGDDLLDGWNGRDTLTGGSGHDEFFFDTALGSANLDTITDFTHGTDLIVLENTGAGLFNGLLEGPLSVTSFRAGPAQDADDRILYSLSNGTLYYDSDGNGSTAAVAFAVLSNKVSVTYADFYVI